MWKVRDTKTKKVLLKENLRKFVSLIREILVKRFLLTFPFLQREILREKLREIP